MNLLLPGGPMETSEHAIGCGASVAVERGRMSLGRRAGCCAVALSGLAAAGWATEFSPEALVRSTVSAGRSGPILFVLIGAIVVSIGLPKMAVSIAAGSLWGLWPGTLAMMVIAAIAASCNYVLARWLFGGWVLRRMDRGNRRRLVFRIARDGGFRLQLLLRLAPIHTVLISCAMGAVGARFSPFLGAAIVGVAGHILWIHAGATAAVAAQDGASVVHWFGVAVAVASALILAIYLPRIAARQLADEAPR